MSKIILMRGDGRPQLNFPPPPASRRSDDLLGHTLMVNTSVTRVYQCGGFSVGPGHPTCLVTEQTQMAQVKRALAEGKLIDVTGTDIVKHGLKRPGGQMSKLDMEETGQVAYVGTDLVGNTYIVTPKNKTHQKKIERELKKTGTISGTYTSGEPEISGIVEHYTKPSKPGVLLYGADGKPLVTESSAKKGKSHGSSASHPRKSGSRRS